MRQDESLQSDWKFNVTTADHVLYFEVQEFRGKTEFLYDARVLSGREPRVLFAFRARADHFARGENEGRRAGLSYSHYHGRETFGIVFGVTCVQGDFFQVQFAVQVDCRDDVPERNKDKIMLKPCV